MQLFGVFKGIVKGLINPFKLIAGGIFDLNKKERLFCYHYYTLRNLREASIKAGYNPKIAEDTAIKLIQREDIRQLILSLDLEKEKKSIEKDIIAILKRIAFNPLQDSIELLFLNEDEAKEKISQLDLFCVSEIKKPRDGTLEIKFIDRYRALEKLLDISNSDIGTQTLQSLYKALNNSTQSTNSEGGLEYDDI